MVFRSGVWSSSRSVTKCLAVDETKSWSRRAVCQVLRFKLNGDEGVRQGRIGVNSDGFLRRWTRGVSTLDLIVMEFRMGCR